MVLTPGTLAHHMRRSTKRDFLQSAGAWNERARLIDNQLFHQSDFFDPRDKVQVKYEMLRLHLVERVSVAEVSRQFGYSRESFYTAVDIFRAKGIVGLIDQKRGPKQPRKLTADVQHFLLNELEKDPSVSNAALVERVERVLSISVHERTIERFRGKKNRRRRRANRRRT